MKLLIEYAKNKNINLNIDKSDNKGCSKLLATLIETNNSEIIQLLIEYFSNIDITFDINGKNESGNYLLLRAVENNNDEIVKLLMDFASNKNLKLNINESNQTGDYPLLVSCSKNNINIIKLLIDYANNNFNKLILNCKNSNGQFPLFCAYTNNNIEIVKLLIDYSEKNKIILLFIEKIINDNLNKNDEIKKLLSQYEERHYLFPKTNNNKKENSNSEEFVFNSLMNSIKFNVLKKIENLFYYNMPENVESFLNKTDDTGSFPLLLAISRRNIKMVKLFMDIAESKNFTLNINMKDKNGNFPLLCSIDNGFYGFKLKNEVSYSHNDEIQNV
ncbi:ankyrin [Neocallimastix californiae]|uniref:Ankyrin n=1 Tax=Neocallimastix californiae TaxID=1754190 RepID=A0A1Y1Z5E1_9FUNG|nr:ankyrin [Neocallimastix californiae]|eukprot:ORY05508.1 ankyrin [Neocallimastix californiae]